MLCRSSASCSRGRVCAHACRRACVRRWRRCVACLGRGIDGRVALLRVLHVVVHENTELIACIVPCRSDRACAACCVVSVAVPRCMEARKHQACGRKTPPPHTRSVFMFASTALCSGAKRDWCVPHYGLDVAGLHGRGSLCMREGTGDKRGACALVCARVCVRVRA